MIKGIYTAASGMQTHSRALDIAGNNLANAATAGFKRDELLFTSFGNALTYRMGGSGSAPLGAGNNGVVAGGIHTRHEQESLEHTGRELDFALAGAGFFTLQRPDGSLALSRNGAFSQDAQGYLRDGAGNLLLGQSGPMQGGTGDFTLDSQGDLFQGGQYLDTLAIFCPVDARALQKEADGLFTGFNPGAGLPFDGSLSQGYLESAGLSPVEEMAALMASSRSFQSCAQLIKMLDTIVEKAVNEIGRL